MNHVAASDRDTPEQDAARARLATRRVLELTIGALRMVTMPPSSPDRWRLRTLVHADLDTISAEHIALLAQLAWRYRRQLPKHLAPKLNPDDPIVRSMRKS